MFFKELHRPISLTVGNIEHGVKTHASTLGHRLPRSRTHVRHVSEFALIASDQAIDDAVRRAQLRQLVETHGFPWYETGDHQVLRPCGRGCVAVNHDHVKDSLGLMAVGVHQRGCEPLHFGHDDRLGILTLATRTRFSLRQPLPRTRGRRTRNEGCWPPTRSGRFQARPFAMSRVVGRWSVSTWRLEIVSFPLLTELWATIELQCRNLRRATCSPQSHRRLCLCESRRPRMRRLDRPSSWRKRKRLADCFCGTGEQTCLVSRSTRTASAPSAHGTPVEPTYGKKRRPWIDLPTQTLLPNSHLHRARPSLSY